MASNRPRVQHRSIRGKIVDMDALRQANQYSPAVGNANMNARGDIIGRSGNVVVRREQIIQSYYKDNPQAVRNTTLKDTPADTFETPQQAVERLTTQINKNQGTEIDEPQNVVSKNKARKLVDKAD